MSNNKHNNNNIINNSIKTTTHVKLNMYKGVLDGNIVDTPINTTECDPYSLQFQCRDNSQYIPLI